MYALVLTLILGTSQSSLPVVNFIPFPSLQTCLEAQAKVEYVTPIPVLNAKAECKAIKEV